MWCDDMRAGHYYRMLQSGPWGVSDPIWGFLSLLAKDAEHYYFYFYQYDHKHYPWIGLLVGLLKVGVHNTHVCPKHFHGRKYSEYSKEVKSKNCVQCTYVCPNFFCIFVQIFWPWRRTGWQWGGFYGEQYLSASDTSNTTTKTRETETKRIETTETKDKIIFSVFDTSNTASKT